VDNSIGDPAPRLTVSVDEPRAADYGVQQQDILDTIALAFAGQTVGVSPRSEGRDPLDIRIRLPKSERNWSQEIATIPVPARLAGPNAPPVELGALVDVSEENGSPVIFRRDGYFADMVMGELAGRFEAPIYGMFEIQDKVKAFDWAAAGLTAPAVRMYGQPADDTQPTLLWDGEWEITYVTFRDMGAAFAVALLAIYILVVGQFRHVPRPADHPDAGSADADRHHDRPLAVRGAIHRHVDDRLHRPCRDYCAQLDPAGGLCPPPRRRQDTAERSAASRRCYPLQTDPADRPGGHDWGSGDPDGPNLPGSGHLTAVRAGPLQRR
jgi:hypothetical protein